MYLTTQTTTSGAKNSSLAAIIVCLFRFQKRSHLRVYADVAVSIGRCLGVALVVDVFISADLKAQNIWSHRLNYKYINHL
jgi:hypothetical protein